VCDSIETAPRDGLIRVTGIYITDGFHEPSLVDKDRACSDYLVPGFSKYGVESEFAEITSLGSSVFEGAYYAEFEIDAEGYLREQARTSILVFDIVQKTGETKKIKIER
jgi:hypothetical protein